MSLSFAARNAENNLVFDALTGASAYFLPAGEPTGVDEPAAAERSGLNAEAS